jgi:3D (Asp-Asp-Asp) domain-containing protein
MDSGPKRNVFRKIILTSSSISLSLIMAGRLASFALAKETVNSSDSGEVLGVQIIQVVPDDPRITSIFKPKQVTINYIDETYTGVTYANTVEEAIDDFDIKLTQNSQVTPSQDTILGIKTTITINEVTKRKHTEYVYIEYDIITQKDPEIEWGKEVVIQPGVTGQKKQIWEYYYLNNVLRGKKLLQEETVTLPQNEIVSVGTKKVFKTTTINGEEITYWRIIDDMKTSTYDRYCDGCTGYTKTGKLLEKGMVAVDPNVIPLGTSLYIPGYGYATAEDIGGYVNGNKIDLGFDKKENWYGKVSYGSYVDVYVLD